MDESYNLDYTAPLLIVILPEYHSVRAVAAVVTTVDAML